MTLFTVNRYAINVNYWCICMTFDSAVSLTIHYRQDDTYSYWAGGGWVVVVRPRNDHKRALTPCCFLWWWASFQSRTISLAASTCIRQHPNQFQSIVSSVTRWTSSGDILTTSAFLASIALSPISAIAKELELGILHWVKIEDITIKRTLSIVINPNRYSSKASQAFSKEILTLFVSPYKNKY